VRRAVCTKTAGKEGATSTDSGSYECSCSTLTSCLCSKCETRCCGLERRRSQGEGAHEDALGDGARGAFFRFQSVLLSKYMPAFAVQFRSYVENEIFAQKEEQRVP
jgi:hypothetical protein